MTAATATAASSDAELDRPAPSGTVLSRCRSIAGTSWPACSSAHSTPAAYAAQPLTWPGPASAARPSQASSCWALTMRV